MPKRASSRTSASAPPRSDANAVTSVELCVDLFASEEGRKGTRLRATGTAARLGPVRRAKAGPRHEELVVEFPNVIHQLRRSWEGSIRVL